MVELFGGFFCYFGDCFVEWKIWIVLLGVCVDFVFNVGDVVYVSYVIVVVKMV